MALAFLSPTGDTSPQSSVSSLLETPENPGETDSAGAYDFSRESMSPAPTILLDGVPSPGSAPEEDRFSMDLSRLKTEPQPASLFSLEENEWTVQNRDLEERMRQWRIDADDVVESAVTDPGFFKDEEFRYATDPASGRLLATNDLFLRAKTDGAPVPVSGLQRDLLRFRVGAALFPGKDVSTEEALGQRITEYVRQKKDRRDLFNSLGEEVMKAETLGSAGEKAPTFETWLEHAVTLPGYERGNDADYYDAWIQNQQAAREHIAPYRNELVQVWKAMKKGGAGSTSEILKEMLPFASVIGDDLVDELQKKDAGALAYEFYDKLDPDARAGFLDGLHLVVKTFPKEEQADILANLAKSGGRMVDDIGQGIMSRFTLKALEEEMNRKGSNSMGWWGLSEADKKLAAENADRIKADRLAQRNFRDAVLRMERDEYAPIRYHSKQSTDFFSMRTLEDGLYAVPSTGAFLGTAAIPYAGPVLSYLAMEDFAYKDLRDNSMKAGRPELESSLFAEDWKSVAAIPQTIVERLQVLAPLGRLPMVNKALGAIGSRFTNRYLGGTAKVLAMNAVETGTEEVQYLMTYAVQDLAHAFAGDTRTAPAEWYNGRDGAFDGFWSRQGTTFVSMLPFAALTGGHGGNTKARDQALAGASSVQRRAFGITGEDSAAIDSAVDPASRAEAIRAALANRDPGSGEARAATEELEKLLADQQEALRQAQDAGLVPRIVGTADGMHAVLDGRTGRKIGTAKDLAGATRIADAHVAAAEEKEADRVAGIAEPLVTGSETSFSLGPEQLERAKALKEQLAAKIAETRTEVDAVPADQIGKLGAFWLKLGELSGITQFPKDLPGKTITEIAANFKDSDMKVVGGDGGGFTEIYSPSSGATYIIEEGDKIYVDTSGASGGAAYRDPTQTKKASIGAITYQIAQAYAKNTGKKFGQDRSVSELAQFRRWPQMLSSSIRNGSTNHLDGSKDVGRWTHGQDPSMDAGLLAMHEAVLVDKYIPEIKDFRLSEDMSKIVDANGAEIPRKTIDDLVSRARDAGALGIGETTLRRAVVTRSAASEAGGNLGREISGRSGGEFGVFQRAVEDLVSDHGRGGSGLGREHTLGRIAYAEGRSPGPLVANLPRAVRSSGGGWTLHDRATGREIGRAATTDEAIRLASEHAGLDPQKDAASMAFLETMFQGGEVSGQLHDTLGLNARTEADISTALESDAATRASAELKARVEAQERMRGGDGSFARLIFGSSTTEIIGNARRVINRILGGGSILTVFHEEGHSLRKAARAAGILTREDDIRMLRAADRILAGKTDRRGGGRLGFLPENFDSLSEAEQDVAIDEGISELLEAEILRTRKGGGTRQLPPGLVSRNLSAFSQLAGDRTAGRYRAFIGAFRQFFGLQMSRAMEIQRALENGTLDRTAYEGYLRKLYDGGTEGKAHVEKRSAEGASAVASVDTSFSLARSSPERDSRPITPLKIPSEVLPGNKADWRKAVRDYISTVLQGRTIINKDTGGGILFNSESRSEAVSKTRSETAHRTALHAESIVESALLLGESAPGKGREKDTAKFEYYALPIEIDGRHATAWFNTRTPLLGENRTPRFYEFGLYEKEAQASPRLEGDTKPPYASILGPAGTVGEFLGQIKHTLPAAIKVAEGADSSNALSAGKELEENHHGDESAGGGEESVGERLSKVVKREDMSQNEYEKAVATKIFESVARKAAEPEDLNAKSGKGVDRSRQLHAEKLTLTPEEVRILSSPYEILLIHTADGRLKKAMLGEKTESSIPGYVPADAIVTHNHPGGRGPSDGDLASTLRNPGRTMRIVTRNENGAVEIFQMKALKKLSAAEIETIKSYYSNECHENGDSPAARRKAMTLTLAEYPDTFVCKNQKMP